MKSNLIKAALTLLLATVLFLPPLSSHSNVDALAKAEAAGAWTINTRNPSYLTKAQAKTFKKATKNLVGVAYDPVLVLAEQTVAGKNYAYLCQATTVTAEPKTTWKIAIVYKDASGKESITRVKNFNFNNLKTLKKAYQATGMDGAWEYNTKPYKSKVLPKSARRTFNKAKKGYGKVSLRALSLLSTQVVAGTNNRYLCRGKADDTVCFYVVDVYKDLKGNAKITDCKVLNIPKYLE